MKLTLRDVLGLERAFGALAGEKLPLKLSYAMAKNQRALAEHLETVNEVIRPSPGYEPERLKLCAQFAEKDEQGRPLTENNEYRFSPAGRVAFETALRTLQEKHHVTPEELAERSRQLEELLDDTVEVDLHRVGLRHVPELPAQVVSGLCPMLIDDSPPEPR